MPDFSVASGDKLAAPSLEDASPRRQGITFHQALLQSCPPPRGGMFGEKAYGEAVRRIEAGLLSRLMATTRTLCFLRTGYMQLVYHLAEQDNRLDEIASGD